MSVPPSSMVEPPTTRRQSPMHDESRFRRDTDESVRGSEQSHININRFTLPKPSWEILVMLVLFVLLVCSLAINSLAYNRFNRNDELLRQAIEKGSKAEADHATELALRRYNLDWFRAHEFAEQEVRIGVLEKLSTSCKR